MTIKNMASAVSAGGVIGASIGFLAGPAGAFVGGSLGSVVGVFVAEELNQNPETAQLSQKNKTVSDAFKEAFPEGQITGIENKDTAQPPKKPTWEEGRDLFEAPQRFDYQKPRF